MFPAWSKASPAVGSIKHVPASVLGVSEPPPEWFGNQPNEAGNETWTNANWLKSRFHFAFAEYHNDKNQNFGVLRVMNDDLVQPGRGFGTHGHRDAEICTYVVEGALTHQDSMGTTETLGAGAIQFMTAGSGVRHSEHNWSDRSLRFIQMWFTPRKRGLQPNYGSTLGDPAARVNAWHRIVSDVADKTTDTAVEINADVNISVAELSEGTNLPLEVKEGRQAYLLCIDGRTTLTDAKGDGVCPAEGVSLARHDAAEVVGPSENVVSGPAHLLLVEMRYDARAHGRRDL